jgi:hypothetical protein
VKCLFLQGKEVTGREERVVSYADLQEALQKEVAIPRYSYVFHIISLLEKLQKICEILSSKFSLNFAKIIRRGTTKKCISLSNKNISCIIFYVFMNPFS